uniref:alpha-1,2-Mannosidase n=1 Tax=Meloidogyne javanica TaxID=6303 RepID=A0A915M4T8_MELJA
MESSNIKKSSSTTTAISSLKKKFRLRTGGVEGVKTKRIGEKMIRMIGYVNVSIDIRNDNKDTVIDIPFVDDQTLGRVLGWCKRHSKDEPLQDHELVKLRNKPVPEWDKNFLGYLSNSELFALTIAADFLDVPGLLDVCCKTIAGMLSGISAENIREKFGIVDDLTADEKAELKAEHQEDNEETDETEEEEKREKAWMEALKKSKTLDLLQQRRHTGDIVQLWDEEKMKMRNALRSDSNFRWTRIRDKDGKYVIPFIITGRFSKAIRQRATIKKAMDKISDNTCVKFRPRRRNENDYVDIQNKINEGCYTTVGQIRGRQVLMLESGWEESCAYPGCTDHSTVIHELMHKVGLWHEQMRYDRDKYIKIHWENIIPGLENQFGKIGQIQSTTYNLPYDYKSIMQYKKNAGARKENLVTMETLDKRYTDVIGNSKDASPEDYKKICSIYKCNKCMGKKEKVKSMFYHAYNGYLNYAYPKDELRPLSCTGQDTWGSYSLTLIDSLDTLLILGNQTEFVRASQIVLNNMDLDRNINISVFETNIRVIGGLLSAHMLSSHSPDVILNDGWPCSGPLLDVAGIGTFILEFGALSRLTGIPHYERIALKALDSLWKSRSELGLVGNHIDVQTGVFTATDSGIGAGVDSYFEYLVKGSLLFQRQNLIKQFYEFEEAINLHIRKVEDAARILSSYLQVLRHLGLPPEFYNIPNREPVQKRLGYPLRPEILESLMYLYKATEDPAYLHVAAGIVDTIEQFTKTKCG